MRRLRRERVRVRGRGGAGGGRGGQRESKRVGRRDEEGDTARREARAARVRPPRRGRTHIVKNGDFERALVVLRGARREALVQPRHGIVTRDDHRHQRQPRARRLRLLDLLLRHDVCRHPPAKKKEIKKNERGTEVLFVGQSILVTREAAWCSHSSLARCSRRPARCALSACACGANAPGPRRAPRRRGSGRGRGRRRPAIARVVCALPRASSAGGASEARQAHRTRAPCLACEV